MKFVRLIKIVDINTKIRNKTIYEIPVISDKKLLLDCQIIYEENTNWKKYRKTEDRLK